MQPPPAPTNPLAEIASYFMSGLLIIGGVILLYTGKIDFAGMTAFITAALAVFGLHAALKAPSPSQQAQIQGLFTQVMSVIPGLIAHAQQPTPVIIHNNLPPNPPAATVPVAAAQPAPVQITPNPAFDATTSINPQMVNTTLAPSWNTPLAPLSGGVPQQPFPERFTAQPPAVSG